MSLHIKDAENRLQLVEMLFDERFDGKFPELADKTAQDVLEMIDKRYFYELTLDGMLYGFIAVVGEDKMIGCWLPEFEDELPYWAGMSFILDRLIRSHERTFTMYLRTHVAEAKQYLPSIDGGARSSFYSNPLLVIAIKQHNKVG